MRLQKYRLDKRKKSRLRIYARLLEKKNEIKAPKQLQPPKIHFEDKKGVVGKGGAENVNDPPENMEDDENKEENGKRVYE